MALSPYRIVLYMVGIVMVLAGTAIFFVQSGLSRWVPTSFLTAGILLLIGLSVMGFADTAPSDREVVHERDEDVTVVRHR